MDLWRTIDSPLAEAVVRWLPFEQGGRLHGPPNVPVYWATTEFLDAVTEDPDMRERMTLSIGLERIAHNNDDS